MATDPKILAAIEAVATEILPPVPRPGMADDGYDWMAALRGTGWTPIPSAPDGRLLGDWPYQIVAHYDDRERGLYGIAAYTEGDLHITGYWDKAARDEESSTYIEAVD